MHRLRHAAVLGAAGALLFTAVPAASAAGDDLGREVLGAQDGFAAADGGTTGGSAATPDHVYDVHTWDEFRAALGGTAARGDTTPRIVYVHGTLDANRRTADGNVDCASYEVPGFDMQQYIDAYDPATYGRIAPSGTEEIGRAASAKVQDAQVRQYIGSNVTIVGVGEDAGIVGGALTVRGSDDVIVRNLHLSDAYDCFTAWDPTDNDGSGAWNAAYDNLWVTESTHVWADHNTFDDGDNPPESLPHVYGPKFEVHDGLLDITNGADLVTVSWNEFRHHDKTNIVGSSDSRTTDRGKLRVTFHHNLWEDIGQRAPRVRYGDVHVYDNLYVVTDPARYTYSWGVGREGEIIAENNYFQLPADVDLAGVVHDWRGAVPDNAGITESGTLVDSAGATSPVSVVDAYNAAHDPDLPAATWTPQYVGQMHPAAAVPALVTHRAGSGVIG